MQRARLNKPKGRAHTIASFMLTAMGVSALLCLPLVLDGHAGTTTASGTEAMAFGIRGPLTAPPLIAQTSGAMSNDSLRDSDGDLLPDVLEWSLLSDPRKADTDGDGISDFVEAVNFTSPLEKTQQVPAVDSFRLLFATTREGRRQTRYLWIHSLIRLASGDIRDLKGINLLFDHMGLKVDLTSLIYTNTKEIKIVKDATHGLLIRFAVRLPMPAGFEKLAPGSFASHALINKSIHTASASMFYLGSAFHTFALVNSKAMILQSAGSGEAQTTFWTSGQACVMTLEVIGSSPGWRICEVKKAECKVVYRGSCSPNCLKSTGGAVLVADGTPLIEGG